ncbi:MAG: citrate lyase subunit alpha [Enterocloster sp.]
MINKVGREIPRRFKGHRKRYLKARTHTIITNIQKRLLLSGPYRIQSAPRWFLPSAKLWKSAESGDNMTLSFHHHFREGDYVVGYGDGRGSQYGNQGHHRLRQLVRKANDAIVPYIEDGTITGIQSSGVRGKIERLFPAES